MAAGLSVHHPCWQGGWDWHYIPHTCYLRMYVFHVYHQSGKDQTLFLLLFSSELTVMIEMFGAGCRNGE